MRHADSSPDKLRMPIPKTNLFASNEAVAIAFADYLIHLLRKQEEIHIALSGGSTPKVLFRILAEEYKEAVRWRNVHFWWGDERCVPPTDEESNYKMTHDTFLKHIQIPDGNIHRIMGENEPELERDRIAAEARTSIPYYQGRPRFDLIILGMGSDGHTASIFPHQMELLDSDQLFALATHPESGQQRITLTGKVINNARAIAFLVTGESKAGKIKEIFYQQGNYKDYPAAHIHAIEGDLTWWLDDAAAVLTDIHQA